MANLLWFEDLTFRCLGPKYRTTERVYSRVWNLQPESDILEISNPSVQIIQIKSGDDFQFPGMDSDASEAPSRGGPGQARDGSSYKTSEKLMARRLPIRFALFCFVFSSIVGRENSLREPFSLKLP